ncbi:MAG: histidine--tRNA ligase [SAR202 cluster bacterium]|nr:histidine--tRNA ligase [SAR202 cluster bacterium]
MQFQAPRGTADILPADQKVWRYVISTAQDVAARFGYERIDTPLFEDARLFVRGIGEVTDIVEKETYTFEDRGGDSLTLRPEGTAPVCRAYLEHGMHNLPQPVRLYYVCPVFRYERPQSGRYRQHHQFGVEAIGDPSAAVDAEVIELGWRLLEELGLRGLALHINSIGDPQCRPPYIRKLQDYYRQHVSVLCEDCKRRLEKNPLRLLDCKQPQCQPVIAGAPRGVDELCGPCQAHWDDLRAILQAVALPHEVNPRLVRGFDYYTRTVFEIVPPVEGSQSTILGGGRYDGLIEQLGGKPTPGLGFGMGIERVIGNLARQEMKVPESAGIKVAILHLGDAARMEAVKLSSNLRRSDVTAIIAPTERGLKGQLRYASAIGATHAVIIGDDELRSGAVQLRDLAASQQRAVPKQELVDLLRRG